MQYAPGCFAGDDSPGLVPSSFSPDVRGIEKGRPQRAHAGASPTVCTPQNVQVFKILSSPGLPDSVIVALLFARYSLRLSTEQIKALLSR
jgi:hypothetical protein